MILEGLGIGCEEKECRVVEGDDPGCENSFPADLAGKFGLKGLSVTEYYGFGNCIFKEQVS